MEIRFRFNPRCGIWGWFILSTAADLCSGTGMILPSEDCFCKYKTFGILRILERVYNARAPRGVWRQQLLAVYRYPDNNQNCFTELKAPQQQEAVYWFRNPLPLLVFSLLPSVKGLEGLRVEKGGRNRNPKSSHKSNYMGFCPHLYCLPCLCLVPKKARIGNWGYRWL